MVSIPSSAWRSPPWIAASLVALALTACCSATPDPQTAADLASAKKELAALSASVEDLRVAVEAIEAQPASEPEAAAYSHAEGSTSATSGLGKLLQVDFYDSGFEAHDDRGLFWESSAAGGGGGQPFELACPNRGYSRGLVGRAGGAIDAVGMLCTDRRPSPRGGGSGGTPFELSCPDEHALTGIEGTAGSYLNSVNPICSRLEGGAIVADERPVVGVAGGNSGKAYAHLCREGEVVTALLGRAGSLVDQLAIRCRPLSDLGSP